MSNKKNIERLFQEQLRDLEVSPNKRVWKGIESKLTKKKRRILPFWWFTSGIAAIFILGFLIFPFDVDNTDSKENLPQEVTTKPKIDNNNDVKIDSIKIDNTEIVNNIDKEKTPEKEESEIKSIPKNSIAKIKKTEKTEIKKKNEEKAIKRDLLAKDEIKKKEKKDKISNTTITNTDKIAQNNIDDKYSKIIEKKDFKKSISKEFEKEKKQQINSKNWSVATSFAVTSSNSFTNSSPLNKDLSNSTEGKNTFSYGVQVAYQINKRWAVQSGIHLQKMRFENNQIAIIPSNKNSSNIDFSNNNSFDLLEDGTNTLSSGLSLGSTNLTGNLIQSYDYFEIPIEIKYNFIATSKFETALVSGFSTLFLNNNEVFLNSTLFNSNGKAKNLNNINFSGNLGFDLNYKLNSRWNLYFNPMFKTQLNSFNNSANGFKPYTINVYSGVRFNF